jgi:hypothetical protein
VQQAVHPQPKYSADSARVAEQPTTPMRRNALAHHRPIRRLVQAHHQRMYANAAKRNADQPSGMRPPPKQGQHAERNQRETLQQGDSEQISPRPWETTDISGEPKPWREDKQIVEGGQRPNGQIARTEMSQKQRQDGRRGHKRRAQRPPDGIHQAGKEIPTLVRTRKRVWSVLRESHGNGISALGLVFPASERKTEAKNTAHHLVHGASFAHSSLLRLRSQGPPATGGL